MEKRILSVYFVLLLFLFVVQGVVAVQTNTTDTDKIAKAYSCLNNEVQNKTCKSMGLSEVTFSLLATGKCKAELEGLSSNNECWPAGKCDIVSTAQAVLALDNNGVNIDDAIDWIKKQAMVPTDLVWYLEIDNEGASTCSIEYDSKKYDISITENKLILGSTGSCLSGNGDYWLTVSPSCYGKEFEIQCDKDFLTTFLFTQKNDATIHVTSKIHSAPAGGKTIEQISSFCLTKNKVCSYEGTLWGAMVLNMVGEDVTDYLPYLITLAKDNEEVFPYPILYMLTDKLEYKSEILNYQIDGKYWKETDKGKYYDTAYALMPFQGEELNEKDNSIDWLFSVQQENGCWDNNNIKNNAFILYSLWPKKFSGGVVLPDSNDCASAGYFCMSSISCSGDILYDYDCPGSFSKCCNTDEEDKTCSELSGVICSADESCSLGEIVYASGLRSYETCCVGGICIKKITGPGSEPEETNTCEENYGICSESCASNYRENSSYTCSGSDICCTKVSSSTKNYTWIWVLLILIILAVVGIIYKDKIKKFFDKNNKNGNNAPKKPDFPSTPKTQPLPVQPRKIIPRSIEGYPQRNYPQMRPKPKSSQEVDDVLNKLKEMSK